MTFQVEWGARKLWTDHLDDVSTIYLNPDSDERLEEPSLALEEFQGDPPYNVEDASDPWADDMKEVFQRGDPGRNDRYGFFLVSLGFASAKKPQLAGNNDHAKHTPNEARDRAMRAAGIDP